jgi:uncharacterized short protein YbdD (DUF466 family)
MRDPELGVDGVGGVGVHRPSGLARLAGFCSLLIRGGRQMCGIPDYESYLSHHRRHHPDRPPLSYEAFFRERIDARYGCRNGNTRCC